jgi:hypothetical protein
MSRLTALAPIASLAIFSAPPAYLVGFVQDTTCAPLPGVEISIGGLAARPVVSDAQGRFVIAVPDERQRVNLSARLAGFRSLVRTNVRIGPGARDSHTLTLDAAGLMFADPVVTAGGQPQIVVREPPPDNRIRGEILTVACTPVADAQITLTANGAALRARPDSAGRFAFPQVAAGAYTLEVRALGYIPVVRRGAKADDGRPVRVLLERGDDGETDRIQ